MGAHRIKTLDSILSRGCSAIPLARGMGNAPWGHAVNGLVQTFSCLNV